ncbi:MAG: tRNA pseudouridine65 synthase [Myxococcota bacterium]|jgi:tRNA pseudouridine65 synthase
MNDPRLLTHRNGLVFLYKPSGWTTHRTAEGGNDLVSWIGTQGQLIRGSRPVHRLDAETSGVLLCAKLENRAKASSWFAKGKMKKTYQALVYGTMLPTGSITLPIDEREAETTVNLLETFVVDGQPLSLVELIPSTGRKHQIRRHLHHVRHPILGDQRYSRSRLSLPAGAPQRLWLHAGRLHVPNLPAVTAPLPPALADHLAALRAG